MQVRLAVLLASAGCVSASPVNVHTTTAYERGLKTIEIGRLHRTRGDDVVIANDEVLGAMRAFDSDRLVTRYEICLDRAGNVETSRREKLSGIEAYDLQVQRTIFREWRFEAYVVDGIPTPVCTHVRLDFVAP